MFRMEVPTNIYKGFSAKSVELITLFKKVSDLERPND